CLSCSRPRSPLACPSASTSSAASSAPGRLSAVAAAGTTAPPSSPRTSSSLPPAAAACATSKHLASPRANHGATPSNTLMTPLRPARRCGMDTPSYDHHARRQTDTCTHARSDRRPLRCRTYYAMPSCHFNTPRRTRTPVLYHHHCIPPVITLPLHHPPSVSLDFVVSLAPGSCIVGCSCNLLYIATCFLPFRCQHGSHGGWKPAVGNIQYDVLPG
ncbi:hypothetical protein V8D89_001845, partial [Ganoderma adspersum]